MAGDRNCEAAESAAWLHEIGAAAGLEQGGEPGWAAARFLERSGWPPAVVLLVLTHQHDVPPQAGQPIPSELVPARDALIRAERIVDSCRNPARVASVPSERSPSTRRLFIPRSRRRSEVLPA